MRKAAPIILIVIALTGGAYLGFVRGNRKPVEHGPSIRVRFLTSDLGNGILAITPEGEAILIDPGPAGAAAALGRYLAKERIRTLNLVLTDPSAERAGSLGLLLDKARIRRIILGKAPARSRTISREIDAAVEGGAVEEQLSRGDHVELSRTVRLASWAQARARRGAN